MNAMILAAGLGTRLKPWTQRHPKALVPVKGIPMLERVIARLRCEGFDHIVVNVHHFPDQIIDFLGSRDFGDIRIEVSDESGRLMDTGGGLVKASGLLFADGGPALVHNVDILSDAPLGWLMERHCRQESGATLLVSERESSRRLLFSPDMRLEGWHNVTDGRYRPEGYSPSPFSREYAFSGIYVGSGGAVEEMRSLFGGSGAFPVMDYFLSPSRSEIVRGEALDGLRLIDIGKPATLSQAEDFVF